VIPLAAVVAALLLADTEGTAGAEPGRKLKPPVKPASASVTRPAPARPEPAAARQEARRCEETEGDAEAALSACREALRLGLREPRLSAVRQLLAVRLADAGRFDELVLIYREDAERHPDDPVAWRRLGAALLFLKEDAAAAEPALEKARSLRPDDAETLVQLGLCLNGLERHQDAVAAFEEALRLDADALGLRPAAKAALEASRRGERWP
jgi:tetratricopeptide (TPR) repeat protein